MEIIKATELKKTGAIGLLYSPPKIGKTTLLSQFPGKTLIVDIDKGTKVLNDNEHATNVKNVDVARISSLKELAGIADDLQKKCDYDTVCIDTVTEIRDSEVINIASDGVAGDSVVRGLEYKDWGYVKNALSLILRKFKTLIDDGVNVVFTAWETSFEIVDECGNKHNLIAPLIGGSDGKDATAIAGMVDIVGRLRINPKTGNRYVQLAPVDNDCVAGDRIFKRKHCAAADFLKGPSKDDKPETKKEQDAPSVQAEPEAKAADTDAGKTKSEKGKVNDK